jgi:toxin YhaV
LALEKIPQDPANPAYRHGGTLGEDRRHWFRAKTGNGRYRLFYRFQSSARIIVLVWVNDEGSLRTYGSRTDAYAVFAGMLDQGNPPDSWDSLIAAAREPDTQEAWERVASARKRKR